MKGLVNVALLAAALSFIVGIISKVTLTPVPILRRGIEAEPLLIFTNTCLLLAIIFILSEKK